METGYGMVWYGTVNYGLSFESCDKASSTIRTGRPVCPPNKTLSLFLPQHLTSNSKPSHTKTHSAITPNQKRKPTASQELPKPTTSARPSKTKPRLKNQKRVFLPSHDQSLHPSNLCSPPRLQTLTPSRLKASKSNLTLSSNFSAQAAQIRSERILTPPLLSSLPPSSESLSESESESESPSPMRISSVGRSQVPVEMAVSQGSKRGVSVQPQLGWVMV